MILYSKRLLLLIGFLNPFFYLVMGNTQRLLNGHMVNVSIYSYKLNAHIIGKFSKSTVKQNAPYNKNDKNIRIWN